MFKILCEAKVLYKDVYDELTKAYDPSIRLANVAYGHLAREDPVIVRQALTSIATTLQTMVTAPYESKPYGVTQSLRFCKSALMCSLRN